MHLASWRSRIFRNGFRNLAIFLAVMGVARISSGDYPDHQGAEYSLDRD
jgi:hypothetical protein